MPGLVVGMILTVALMRINSENMGIPLSEVEHVAYIVGAAIALLVAVLASLVPARRAASVQPRPSPQNSTDSCTPFARPTIGDTRHCAVRPGRLRLTPVRGRCRYMFAMATVWSRPATGR
jgi:hypothetical protein